MQRTNGTRSSPVLAAAFNLRQFTEKSGKGQLEPPRLYSDVLGDTEKHAATRKKVAEQQALWRQREDDERGITRAREREAKLVTLQDRGKRKALRNQRLQAKEEEEAARWRAQRLEDERVRREEEESRIEEETERVRVKKKAEEAERKRRAPWECTNCKATGKCLECDGKGYHIGLFLVSTLNHAKHPLEFGNKHQGCETCGGLKPGIRGKAVMGDGICTVCHGHGMLWPNLAENSRRRQSNLRRVSLLQTQQTSTGCAGEEPLSPLSPKSPSPW